VCDTATSIQSVADHFELVRTPRFFLNLAFQQQVATLFTSKQNIIAVGQNKKKSSFFAHTHREKKSNQLAEQQ